MRVSDERLASRDDLIDMVKDLRATLQKAERERDEARAELSGIVAAVVPVIHEEADKTKVNISAFADRAMGAIKSLAAERDAALAQASEARLEAQVLGAQLAALRDELENLLPHVNPAISDYDYAKRTLEDTAAAAQEWEQRIRDDERAKYLMTMCHNPDVDDKSLAAELIRDGMKRGAEAMRERCANEVDARIRWESPHMSGGLSITSTPHMVECAAAIRALEVEDKENK